MKILNFSQNKLFFNFSFFLISIQKFLKFYLSLLLGAHLTMLSTLMIISAASLADSSACSLTLKHSLKNSY